MQRVVAFVLTSVVAASSLHAQTGHPVYGRWGFDTTGIDRSVKPGDDFFSFVNGTWVKNTVIPVDKSVYSPRAAMSDNTEARLRTIMEKAQARAGHAPTTDAGKVGAFYASFMDSARIERLGAKPLAPVLRDIRAATTQRALTALMGKSATGFYGSAFGFGIDADLKHPDRYVVYLNQGGLTLPDRDYYLEPDMSKERAGFEAYVATMLTRLDWPDAAQRAKDVVALETRFAEVSWDRTQQRDYTATYNPMTVQALSTMAPAFDWPGFLANAGLRGESSVIVGEKSAFPKIAAVLAQTPVNVLQAWMAFGATDLAAPYLSSPFVNASFVFRGTVLSGQQAQSERWKRGVHAVSGGDYGAGGHFDRFGNIGWAVGTLYAAQYFPPAAKAKIVALVNDLKAAYRVRIAALDWMSAATRTEALKKLDTYVIKVGYPDTPRDYSRVVIRDDDLVGNVERAAAADWAFYANRRHGPVDRSDWAMTPQTNDAYNGSLRDIVFPAGILQPPIFDANADDAYNYGAAGGVIGHELTHGFDDEGRKIDATGALRDWWSKEDAATFDARAAMLGAQYSAYEPLPGLHVNGQRTMGENIADLGGLTLALAAYRTHMAGKTDRVLDGFTGEQRVFIGWAQAWRGKSREDALRMQVTSNEHSPRFYRVNGPSRNTDAWYDLFGVKPGEALYLAPKDRVRIW